MMTLGRPETAHWILVTGTPRSGTTFTGLMLSTPRAVDYIHEPFNPDCGLPGVTQEYLYTRRGLANEPAVRAMVEAMLAYRFRLRTGYYRRDTARMRIIKRVVGSRGPFYLRLAKLNALRRAVIVKDPKACLLTGYLAREFRLQPIVLLRHPAAFVASQLRLGPDMKTELAALAAQPALLADYFGDNPAAVTPTNDDPLIVACQLWSALTRVMLAQARQLADATIVRHEDLSADPLRGFAELFRTARLPWTPRVARRIARLTQGGSAEARGNRTQDFRRNSTSIFDHRLHSLDVAQRRHIFELVGDVAPEYYPRDTFGL